MQGSIIQYEDICVCVRGLAVADTLGQAIKCSLSLMNLKIRMKWAKHCCYLLALGARDSRQRQ